MTDKIAMSFDSSRLNAALDRLVVQSADNSRAAAQAGAQVFYDEVKRRVPVAEKPSRLKGGRLSKPGALAAAIYQAFSRDNSSQSRSTYHISWNKTKAPHGHLVEFGHIQRFAVFRDKAGNWVTSKRPLETPRHVAAQPFLRPAYDAKLHEALTTVKATYAELMKNVLSGAHK